VLREEIAAARTEIIGLLPSEFTHHFMRMPVHVSDVDDVDPIDVDHVVKDESQLVGVDPDEIGLEKFSFDKRPYLPAVYDTKARKTLLMCGRQTEKTTSLGNQILTYSCMRNHFKSLYVSPTETQTTTFSRDRIAAPIKLSKRLKLFKGSNPTFADNVMFKEFITHANITLRYAYLHADRVRGVFADLLCFAEGTRVLTKSGWVAVEALTTDHLVADVGDDGVVSWQHPANIFGRRHTGEMVQFGHRAFELRVTGNHQMWANRKVKATQRVEDKYEFVEAAELARLETMGFKLTCGAAWADGEASHMVIPPVEGGYGENAEPLELELHGFAELTGWYLAEGHIQWGRHNGEPKYAYPVITQAEGRYLDEMLEVVRGLGLDFKLYSDPRAPHVKRMVIRSRRLGDYYAQLGGSYDKYIPREFFAQPEALEGLLYGLYLGDACYHAEDEWDEGVLRTRSVQLAEDAQEAWLRLGRPAAVHERQSVPVHQDTDLGAEVRDPVPMYEVHAHKRDYYIFWRADFQRKRRVMAEVVTDEQVYCFTVPSHRPIVKGSLGSKPVIVGQCIDELQDIIPDIIPVIEQSLSHSPYRILRYAGTPKSLDNTIAWYWENHSTMNEWVIPCDACNHWNIPGEKHIGLEHLICDKCGKQIYPNHDRAQWASMRSPKWLKDPPIKRPFEGYRIPQIITPWVDWHDINDNRRLYTRAKFINEVLGQAYDHADKLLTKSKLLPNCTSSPMTLEHALKFKSNAKIYFGIDWGGGSEAEEKKSFTVLTVGAYLGGKFTFIYFKRYEGAAAEDDVMMADIIRLANLFGVSILGTDYGGGHVYNGELIRTFGLKRLARYQYVGTKQIYFDKHLARFMVNRTEALMALVNALTRHDMIRLPQWDDIETPFMSDLLAVFAETAEHGRKTTVTRSPGASDDTIHAMLYCLLASMIHYPRPDIIAPVGPAS